MTRTEFDIPFPPEVKYCLFQIWLAAENNLECPFLSIKLDIIILSLAKLPCLILFFLSLATIVFWSSESHSLFIVGIFSQAAAYLRMWHCLFLKAISIVAVHVDICVRAVEITERGSVLRALVRHCASLLLLASVFCPYLHSAADRVCLHNLHHVALCLCCLSQGCRLSWVFTHCEYKRLSGVGGV